MDFIIDIVFVVIILFCMFMGFRRGFTRSLISICVKAVSFTTGLILSNKFAPMLYNSQFKDGVMRNIDMRVDDSVSANLSEQVTTVSNSVPNVLSGIAKIFNVNELYIEEKIDAIKMSDNVAATLESAVVGPIVNGICRIIIFAIVSIACSIILGAVANIVCGFVRLPKLKKCDEILGISLGLFNGIFVTMLLSYFIVIVASLIDSNEIVRIVDSSIFIDLFSKIKIFV